MLLLLAAVAAIARGACIDYPAEFTACAGISHKIYVDEAELVALETELAIQKASLTTASQRCYLNFMPMLCSVVFPKCNNASDPNPDPVPVLPFERTCKSRCDAAATECQSTFAALDLLGIELDLKPTPAFCANATLPIPGLELVPFFNDDAGTCEDYAGMVDLTVSACLPGYALNPQATIPCCAGTPPVSRCDAYTGSVCAGLVPWGAEGGPGVYFSSPLEDQATKEAELAALTGLFSLLDASCYDYAMRFFCAATFPPCQLVQSEVFRSDTSVPAFPCQSLCSETLSRCAADLLALEAAGLALPEDEDGNSIIPTCQETLVVSATLPPVPQFPESSVLLPAPIPPISDAPTTCLGTDVIDAPCEPGFDREEANGYRFTVPEKRCPYPLLLADSGNCELACPSPFFDKDEYDAAINMMRPLAWFSFIGSSVVITTWVLFKEKRQFPSILILYLAICTFWAGIGLIMSSTGDYEEIWCKSPTQYWSQSDGGTCVASAMFIYYFGVAGSMWWFTIGLNLFMSVVREVKNFGDYMPWFHVANWSLPMIGLIINLAESQFGYGFGAWCFVLDKEYQYGTFYVPISILIFADIVMAVMVTHKIVKITRASGTGAKLSIGKQIRPLAFVFSFTIVFVIICSYRFDVGERESAYEDSIGATVICNASGGTNCGFDPAPDYGLFMTNVFSVNLLGVLVFAFFGATKATWGAWKTGVNGSLTRLSRNSRGSKSTPGHSSQGSRNVEMSRNV